MRPDESNTLYKLIILYLLSIVDFPLTTSQLSEFVLDRGYTTYFKFQQALHELAKDNMLVVEATHNRSLYHLTTDGLETIALFEQQLAPAVKDDVKNYIKEKRYDLQGESGAKSTFHQTAQGDYMVRCTIMEGGVNQIDLKISVTTEKEAEAMASNWIKKNELLYTTLIRELL